MRCRPEVAPHLVVSQPGVWSVLILPGLGLVGYGHGPHHHRRSGGERPGPWIGGILGAPVGLASVLFFVISGVSLSVIAKQGSGSALPDVLRRRGSILLIFGLLLSARSGLPPSWSTTASCS